MQLGEGIRTVGFRKWYERALIHSHLYLLLTILCTVGLLATFEVTGKAHGAERAFDLMALVLFAVVGGVSLRRYIFLLMHAENTASQAVCSDCKAYGALRVEQENRRSEQLVVACKRCGHRWPIHNA
jgi:DNA-directed RNA polymerase subunit RPC12/RpoP